MDGCVIRTAVVDEADVLSRLALRSKAIWGYSEDFLERCKSVLTLTDDYIERYPVFIAEVAGFCSLKPKGRDVELDNLFVEPSFVRRGIGSLLLDHARRQARSLGYRQMTVESDPLAEGFYIRAGAVRIGEVSSTVEEDRCLPLLVFDLEQSQCADPNCR